MAERNLKGQHLDISSNEREERSKSLRNNTLKMTKYPTIRQLNTDCKRNYISVKVCVRREFQSDGGPDLDVQHLQDLKETEYNRLGDIFRGG